MEMYEVLIAIAWVYLGMYGYIYWMTKRNKLHHKKWRGHEVKVIPMMGIFGPLSFVVGYILFKK